MTGDGAILDFRGPLANGNGIHELTYMVPAVTRVPRAANSPRRAKVLNQLFFTTPRA